MKKIFVSFLLIAAIIFIGLFMWRTHQDKKAEIEFLEIAANKCREAAVISSIDKDYLVETRPGYAKHRSGMMDSFDFYFEGCIYLYSLKENQNSGWVRAYSFSPVSEEFLYNFKKDYEEWDKVYLILEERPSGEGEWKKENSIIYYSYLSAE
ncbi:MAG: hypothetical protein WC322_01795 [Candidatus Paceibacterota bacterium]|jgi:uncharacterized protein YxeA